MNFKIKYNKVFVEWNDRGYCEMEMEQSYGVLLLENVMMMMIMADVLSTIIVVCTSIK
jgi:hypothetical protein